MDSDQGIDDEPRIRSEQSTAEAERKTIVKSISYLSKLEYSFNDIIAVAIANQMGLCSLFPTKTMSLLFDSIKINLTSHKLNNTHFPHRLLLNIAFS